MKVFFRRIHLYLSLAAGIPILIACITGAILVFEKDLEQAFHKDRYYVTPAAQRLPLEQVKTAALDVFPEHKVTSAKVYSAPDRSVELNLAPDKKAEAGKESEAPKRAGTQQQGKAQAGKGQAGPAPSFTVFMNPYTGDVIEKYSYRETFFFQVMALHRWFLGKNDGPGKMIMGVSTFIFLFILVTGIVLWWPRTRKILLQRLRIKKDAGFKRLNHDLHIVLGFYSAIFLFIFAFTAMNWSFEWFGKALFAITKSSPKPAEPPKATDAAGTAIGLDKALVAAQNTYANAVFYNIALPKDSADVFTVQALPTDAAHENATHTAYVHPFSGTVIKTMAFTERNAGQRARSFVKPLHTGSIWGLPSKIIAFVICILGASFPITGVIMWQNRTRKKNPKRKPVAVTA